MGLGTLGAVSGAARGYENDIFRDKETARQDQLIETQRQDASGIRQEARNDRLAQESRALDASNQQNLIRLAMSNPQGFRDSGMLTTPEGLAALKFARIPPKYVLGEAERADEATRQDNRFRAADVATKVQGPLRGKLLDGLNLDTGSDEPGVVAPGSIRATFDEIGAETDKAALVSKTQGALAASGSTYFKSREEFVERTGFEPDSATFNEYQLQMQTGERQSQDAIQENAVQHIFDKVGKGTIPASRDSINNYAYARLSTVLTPASVDRILMATPPEEVPKISDVQRERIRKDSKDGGSGANVHEFMRAENKPGLTNEDFIGTMTFKSNGLSADDRTVFMGNMTHREYNAKHFEYVLNDPTQDALFTNERLTQYLLNRAYSLEEGDLKLLDRVIKTNRTFYFMLGVNIEQISRVVDSSLSRFAYETQQREAGIRSRQASEFSPSSGEGSLSESERAFFLQQQGAGR